MKFYRFFVPVLVTLFFSSASYAFFVEPIVGYSMAKYEASGDDDTDNALYFGGRIGMGIPAVPMLWFAVDGGSTTGGTYKDKSASTETDSSRLMIGLDVGMDIPVVPLLDRVWLGYNFIDNNSFDNSLDQKYKGTSLKLGVGFKFVPFVSLNLEYIKTSVSKIESTAGTSDADLSATTFLASISVPLP